MRTPKRQRGFLLNPYRFQGSTIGRPATMGGEAGATFGGASVFSSAMNSVSEAEASLDSQTTKGAGSMAGESTVTMTGASVVSGSLSGAAEAGLTVDARTDALTCDAADFDGTNDILKRGANFTGIANSKKGILSLWVRLDAVSFSAIFVGKVSSTDSKLLLAINSGTFTLDILRASASSTVLTLASNGSKSTGIWYHVLMAWDRAAGVGYCYVNDVDESNLTNGSDENAPYTSMVDWHVGAHVNDTLKTDGCVADVYFAPGQYIDISVESNRRKFITADGTPAKLGATGDTPTGTAPILYSHLDDGETANNLAINRGTGGNLTVTGGLATCATSPSD